jgi:hypothetical protein
MRPIVTKLQVLFLGNLPNGKMRPRGIHSFNERTAPPYEQGPTGNGRREGALFLKETMSRRPKKRQLMRLA